MPRKKDLRWCQCTHENVPSCTGCLIEKIVLENMGRQGLVYLKERLVPLPVSILDGVSQ